MGRAFTLSFDTPLERQPDAALIERYVAVRDEVAFRELVRRHGPMVLSTCSRMLRHRQDGEDAFQAVFVILSARCRAVRRVRSLGGWLHGVAVRVCYRLLRTNRRRARWFAATEREEPAQENEDNHVCELHEVLDEELTALPTKYREAIILCDLEGHTREEAARILNASANTVNTWVDRGRRSLRDRLVRRGVTLIAGGLTLAAAQWAAGAPMTTQLVQQTLQHAELFLLSGTKVMGTAAATRITSLAQGVLNDMFLTKLSTTVGIAALALALVLGVSPGANILGFGTGARASTIFFDDFEDGSVTDGSPVTWLPGSFTGGTSQVVAGSYEISGTVVSSSADGTLSFRDGSIRTQLRFLESNNATVAFLNARSPTVAAYLGVIRQDGLIAIAESSDASALQIHSEIATSLDPVARDVVLQLDTIGNRISLWAWHAGDPKPNQPQLVVLDDTLTFGSVVVGIGTDARIGAGGFSRVAFRHFEAVPEPSTAALGSLGLVALASFACRARLRRIGRSR
jgi:RNA polymerase sigma factor (sigma-70 family)